MLEVSCMYFNIDFVVEDIGKMFGVFGFDGLFNGGKMCVYFDGIWLGGLLVIILVNLDGKFDVYVIDGCIFEVILLGVGCLFGLVLLVELLWWFMLDFGDVFGKGLVFDIIDGSFNFVDGNVIIKDFKIYGFVVEIIVSGCIGMCVCDYD